MTRIGSAGHLVTAEADAVGYAEERSVLRLPVPYPFAAGPLVVGSDSQEF